MKPYLEDFQLKETIRAQRRHDAERIKAVRARRQALHGSPGAPRPSDKQVGVLGHTAALCSCVLCGNPRKFFGERTVQELREMQPALHAE